MRATIGTMLIPTTATRLTRMPGVNLLDGHPLLLRFVANQAVELGKRPTVQAAFVVHILVALASSHLGSHPNVGQIF